MSPFPRETRVEGAAAAAYIRTWMAAGNRGGTLNAAKVSRDALAARTNTAALARLRLARFYVPRTLVARIARAVRTRPRSRQREVTRNLAPANSPPRRTGAA